MTNCYVFHGPEEFLRAEAIQALRAQLGDSSMAAMHTTLLEGRKLTLGELSLTADALPFLADKRLVVVTGLLGRLEGKGGKPSKADQAFAVGLAEYLPRVPSSTWLVFDEDRTLEDAHPVLKVAKEHPQTIKAQLFGRLSEVEWRRWIGQRAQAKGGEFAGEAIEALATMGELDLRLLDQEIEKLVTYAHGRAVTRADVQQLVHAARAVDVFAMVDALGQRNGRKAIEQFHALVADGEPPIRLLFMITRQFRMILQAKDLSEQRASLPDVMRGLGAPRFVAEKMLTQARAFSMAQLEHIYRRLLETDQHIKTGQTEPLLAADMLIAEIAAQRGTK